MEPQEYTPSDYWDERLSRDFSLRGTGHISYSDAYNRWLYRRKGDVLDAALETTPRGGHALDIGSGTGWVVDRLIARGFEVEGCDVSPVAVARLGDRYGAERFFEAAIGAHPLPRPDASADLVTVMDVLYHVTAEDQWLAALADISRLLAPGGKAIVSDAFAEEPLSPAPHVRFRSARDWHRGLAAAELEIERLLPLYSWLSRDPGGGRLERLPGRIRGPLEYGLERLAPRQPHLRCAVIGRPRTSETGL